MSYVKIRINGDVSEILPEGIEINAEIDTNKPAEGIDAVRAAIDYICKEESQATGKTPGERVLSDQIDSIQKIIISVLSPEQKLLLANSTMRT